MVFSTLLLEPFNSAKLLVAVAGGVVLAGGLVAAVMRRHRPAVPRATVWLAMVAFVVLAITSTVGSAAVWRSLVGASNARAGLLLYLVCALLFAAASATAGRTTIDRFVRVLLIVAVAVMAYALVQAAGADPLRWRVRAGGPPIFATFGNANFLSGWLGVVSVLGVWAATASGWSGNWRRLAAVVVVGGLGVSAASASIQGPIAALAGTAVLVAAALTDHGRHRARRRWARQLAAALLPIGVVAGAALMLAARGGGAQSFATRTGKWQAAVAMAADQPLTGVGLDLFGDWYHAYRPLSDAVTRGISHTADAAHNVPLQLLAGGGVPLFLAYLAFVTAVAVTLVRGIRRSHGSQRMLLAGLGGAWVAYLVQSLVSMDVPPLAVLGWALAGLGVGAARPAAAVRFPACVHRPWSQLAALAGAVLAAAAILVITIPVRADVAARRAVSLTGQSRHAAAEDALRTALRLNPWEPSYAVQLARLRTGRGDHSQALEAYRLAVVRQPRGIPQAVEAPRVAAAAGDHELAAQAYDAALELDPRSPELLVEAARHGLRHGDRALALERLRLAAEYGGRSGQRAARILRRLADP